jgi:hypothetical protein
MISSRLMPLALLLAASPVFAQDYFPLATGNQWIFRSAGRSGQTLHIEVGDAKTFDGAGYFAVYGFHRGPLRWLRTAEGGAIVEYFEDEKTSRPFLSLDKPVGERFAANVDGCNRAATVTARDAKLSLAAAGDFTNILSVRYSDSICADAGLESDFFLPNIGLVKRVETSFAGPVTYELAYARVNGFITLQQPENSFSLSTPSPIVEGSRIFARLTLRNGVLRNGAKSPLRLDFNSGQIFNLILTEAASGRVVYNWASDKLFTQALQTVEIDGEANWAVDFPTPQPLTAGSYILEAFLTTSQRSQAYRSTVSIDVVVAP